MAISTCTPAWIQEVTESYTDDTQVQNIVTLLAVDTNGPSLWHYSAGILKRKGKVYIGSNGILRQKLISSFHDTPLGGHSG